MKRSYIELRGVNTHNKGAQLMMMAVADRFQGRQPLTIAPNGSDFSVRSALGFRQTLILNQAPRLTAALGNRVPPSIRSSFGLTADGEIAGVLDAAGFAYSDAFSSKRSEREAKLARRWKKAGVPLVLLPQAFGPFENADQARWSRELLECADLVFARDQQSYDHVRRLSRDVQLRLSPDFTIGLKPVGLESPVVGDFGAIVPNAKMVSHTGMTEAQYGEFLIDAARSIRAHELRPVLVVHEFNDRALARLVAEATGAEIFESPDPLTLKRVLADARVVVASRFHALVSALSSSTPVVALGWSHKYTELLADFGAREWLADAGDPIADRVAAVLGDADTAEALERRVAELTAQNEKMWSEVESTFARAKSSGSLTSAVTR